jgi:hypothetical protein
MVPVELGGRREMLDRWPEDRWARRGYQEHSVYGVMWARPDHVVEPQEAAKRMTDNDAFPRSELLELRAKKSHPALELRSVGVRELGIDHDLSIRSQCLSHVVLPVPRWAMVFNAVNDQEAPAPVTFHLLPSAATDLFFVRA